MDYGYPCVQPKLATPLRFGTGSVVRCNRQRVFTNLFNIHPRLRGYILDDTGDVRKHVAILVDGESIKDRAALSDALPKDAKLLVLHRKVLEW